MLEVIQKKIERLTNELDDWNAENIYRAGDTYAVYLGGQIKALREVLELVKAEQQ